MSSGLGQPPVGAPGWLSAVWVGLAVLIAIFGRGFGSSVVSGVRSLRAGFAARESRAREQERQLNTEARVAEEAHDAALYGRMREQMNDMATTIRSQGQQIEELREGQRQQYAWEQATMSHLSAHAVWDLATKPHLPKDFPEPPPLLPQRAVQHSQEWGPSPA